MTRSLRDHVDDLLRCRLANAAGLGKAFGPSTGYYDEGHHE